MSSNAVLKDFEPVSLAQTARIELLDQIAQSMLKHDLEITPENMAAICSAVSGSDPTLAKVFAAREISGEPIDQAWLDDNARKPGKRDERRGALDQLMDSMESTLSQFSQTARTAQNATSEQRGAIDAQLEEMSFESDSDRLREEVERVVSLSRTMVDRFRSVEHAMQRSQAETDQLRDSLAKARNEADIDHLTRLPNRRAFERFFNDAVERAQTTNTPLSVAFCDVDHFKSVNDTHGHDAGDRVLVSIASALNKAATNDCFVARHGGEEFALIFRGNTADEARIKLDRIRAMQAHKQMMNRESGKPFGKITFSAGIAELIDLNDPREALSRADKALYNAKNAGRNRIEIG